MYYYSMLNAAEQSIYRKAERVLALRKTPLVLDESISLDCVNRISRFVTFDYPEYYWTKGQFDTVMPVPGMQGRSAFFPVYLLDEKDVQESETVILSAIRQICSGIPEKPEDRVQVIFDWFLDHVEYDADRSCKDFNQTVYSVFILHRSVCMGLAKAFHLILRLLGMEDIILMGYLFGDTSVRHAWNLVKTPDGYRHVDIAASYPCFSEYWRRISPGLPGRRVLLLPEEELYPSHQMISSVACPSGFSTVGGV